MDGVEEPERRIRGVVQALLGSLRKHVRNQPVAHVVAERPQDVARLALPARAEREPFEADHGVAAPIREPVVAGDHRAHFIAHRPGARRFFDAAGGSDDELIGGLDQLLDHPPLRDRPRRFDEPRAPAMLGVRQIVRSQGADRFPRLRGRDERPGRVGRQHQAEIPGTPEIAAAFVAAVLLELVQHGREDLGNHRERLLVPVDEQAQRRQFAAGLDLEPVAQRVHAVRNGERMVDRRLVKTEREERPKLQPHGLGRQQRIRNVRRVLEMRHEHALLEAARPRRRTPTPAAPSPTGTRPGTVSSRMPVRLCVLNVCGSATTRPSRKRSCSQT